MVHKRPKIALIRVVSVTGYSLSFILLCLAGSIQMRWVPTSHGKTAKAGQCLPPQSSDHLKLTATGASPGAETLSFVHPGLRKGDILPRFATTRVAKKSIPARPAPIGVKSALAEPVTRKEKQSPAAAPAPAQTAAISIWRHHTPPMFGPVRSSVRRLQSSPIAPAVSSLAPAAAAPALRPHHTPPMLPRSAAAEPALRPHHTPPAFSVQTVQVPLPLEKPLAQQAAPAKLGAVVDPANAAPPEARQNLKRQSPASATAGFAITGATRPRPQTPPQPELALAKPPIFREKPAIARRPVNENRCLALALYYEARRDGEEAQIGLAKVIMSRVKSRHYPNTVCGVVYQNAHLRGRCAFSFACDGLPEQPKNAIDWTKSRILALNTLCGTNCLPAKGKSHSVHNAKQRAQGPARTSSAENRQITDQQMKHMGRDGVNAFLTGLTPVF